VPGDVDAVVALEDAQRTVHSGQYGGGGDDAAVVHVPDAARPPHVRVLPFETVEGQPAARRGPAGEQAGAGQQPGAGADTQDPGTVGVALPQPVHGRLQLRGAGLLHLRHHDPVDVADIGERMVGHQIETAGQRDRGTAPGDGHDPVAAGDREGLERGEHVGGVGAGRSEQHRDGRSRIGDRGLRRRQGERAGRRVDGVDRVDRVDHAHDGGSGQPGEQDGERTADAHAADGVRRPGHRARAERHDRGHDLIDFGGTGAPSTVGMCRSHDEDPRARRPAANARTRRQCRWQDRRMHRQTVPGPGDAATDRVRTGPVPARCVRHR
jgi:hypothetical protein